MENRQNEKRGVKFNAAERQQIIAIDSSGLRLVNGGEYRMMKHGKMKEWMVESAFSRYKRVVGGNLFSKKFNNIEKEIVAKSNLLNKFATM